MPGGVYPPDSVVMTWPYPNYRDPVTQGNGVVILISILGSLALFVVSTRLIARAFVQRNFGIDDWIMLVAMVPTIALAIGMCLAVNKYHFDIHVWDLRPGQYVSTRKIYWANDVFYILASGLIKISILLFYKRMSKGTFSRKFVYVVWACIAFVIAYMVTFILVLVLGCRPLSAFWWSVNPVLREGRTWTCISEPKGTIAATSISLVQDFIAASLPMALFATLQIPKRQRIALAAVFAFGYFLCIANGIRMYYIYKVFYETYDTTWYAYYIWLWTAVEILLAPICASAPALKVYFRGILRDHQWNTWGSSRRSGSRGGFRRARSVEGDMTYPTETIQSTEIITKDGLNKNVMDSPTLGGQDINNTDIPMDHFGNGRNSALSANEKMLPLQESKTPRGRMTKVEKMLGL